jgi:hypothetical protein
VVESRGGCVAGDNTGNSGIDSGETNVDREELVEEAVSETAEGNEDDGDVLDGRERAVATGGRTGAEVIVC